VEPTHVSWCGEEGRRTIGEADHSKIGTVGMAGRILRTTCKTILSGERVREGCRGPVETERDLVRQRFFLAHAGRQESSSSGYRCHQEDTWTDKNLGDLTARGCNYFSRDILISLARDTSNTRKSALKKEARDREHFLFLAV